MLPLVVSEACSCWNELRWGYLKRGRRWHYTLEESLERLQPPEQPAERSAPARSRDSPSSSCCSAFPGGVPAGCVCRTTPESLRGSHRGLAGAGEGEQGRLPADTGHGDCHICGPCPAPSPSSQCMVPVSCSRDPVCRKCSGSVRCFGAKEKNKISPLSVWGSIWQVPGQCQYLQVKMCMAHRQECHQAFP